MNALKLFRTGLDTVQIAARMDISEAAAADLVWRERCKEKRLAAIYSPAPRRLFPTRPLRSKDFVDPSSIRIKAAGC